MNSSKYVINPCSSCTKKYGIKDINNINQCCYDTLGAFTGNTSLNSYRDSPVADVCKRCIQNSIKALGRDPCEFRPAPYPNWVQVPHYFPALLETSENPEEALLKCEELCKTNQYPNECKEACQMDYDSTSIAQVENYEREEENYNMGVAIFLAVVIVVVIVLIIAWVIYRKMKKDSVKLV